MTKTITITNKDIKDPYYGSLINELAYAGKQWTEDDLWENNLEYEPYKPYDFNYEDDLFKATSTPDKLYKLAKELNVPLNANWERIAKEQKLQAGATVALNNVAEWNDLLRAYTDKLEDDRTDGISDNYNKVLQEELDYYQKDQYKEWLWGDHRDYSGVVYEISKYFTSNTDGDYDEKTDEYTFTLDDEDVDNMMSNYEEDTNPTDELLKKELIASITGSIASRRNADKVQAEKNKIEREKTNAYKAERAKENEDERKAKLLAMKQ